MAVYDYAGQCKYLREKWGFSQRQLADYIGCNRCVISLIENGYVPKIQDYCNKIECMYLSERLTENAKSKKPQTAAEIK